MAYDELIGKQLTELSGWLTKMWDRWVLAANRSRTTAYGPVDLFADMRSQFVDNWDTWNTMMEMPTEDMIPAVVVRGKWNLLTKSPGEARVKYRLTYATYHKPELFRVPPGGAFTFLPTEYDISDMGDFEGKLFFKVKKNLAAAPAAPEIYRGMLFVEIGKEVRPLAWLIVVAEP